MELVPKEERFKSMAKGRELLYVSDWDWTGNLISILVNKSDKGMSDPVFTIPQAGQRRTGGESNYRGFLGSSTSTRGARFFRSYFDPIAK